MSTKPETTRRNDTKQTVPNDGRAQTWKDLKPWEGKATRGDGFLLGFMFAIPLFHMATYPVRPFLIANAPMVLQFVVGSKGATGAAAAYASVGRFDLWLVVLVGILGMAKFDWLFWFAGRRWGARVLTLFAGGPSAEKWVARLQRLPRWVMPLMVAASRLPILPGPVIWLVAGIQGMRWWMFVIFDLIAAAIIVGGVSTAGYLAGETGIALIQTIDNYALWVSVGLIFVVTFIGARKAQKAPAAAKAEVG